MGVLPGLMFFIVTVPASLLTPGTMIIQISKFMEQIPPAPIYDGIIPAPEILLHL